MQMLSNKVAVVTGASRGIGRGVARELAREGAHVVIAARTLKKGDTARIDGDGAHVPGSLEEVQEEIEEAGGSATAYKCDLASEAKIRALISDVEGRFGGIDVLVNNAMPQETMIGRFWEMPVSAFDNQMTVGPRAYYIAAVASAPRMIERGSGLIVNISSPGACVDFYGAPYRIARAASDRMAQALAADLENTGVGVVSLWPPAVRTERLLMAVRGEQAGFDLWDGFDPAKRTNSPDIVGRAIAHLAADETCAGRSGTVVTVAELAELYGFSDVDGKPAVRLQNVRYLMQTFGQVTMPAYTKIKF